MSQLADVLRNMGMARIISLVTIAVSVLAIFGFLMFRASHPEMAPLFTQLDAAQGGQVISRLQSMKVPYEVSADGSIIFAPVEEIARLRMDLAQDGISTGGTLGYEIFDKSDLMGSSGALYDINKIRALEGELVKSIKTIQGVMNARVHLVIPKRELFSKEKPAPSASVLMKMYGGSSLSAGQVQSIQYLISSAITGLTVDRVSVVDDKGNLLAKGSLSGSEDKDHFTQQQEVRHTLEDNVSRTVESLLDRYLGYGKSRAQVSLEMDFNQETSQTITYDPDGAVVRSSTTSNESSKTQDSSSAGGLTIGNAIPQTAGGGTSSGAGGSGSNNTGTQESMNYEVSNTTKNMVKEIGQVKRMSVAVMIDGIYEKAAGSDKETYKPRDEAEIKKLTELVKTAVGFDDKRGDSINLINLQFAKTPELEAGAKDEKSPLNMNKLIEIGAISLLSLIALFIVVRPIMQGLFGLTGAPKSENGSLDEEDQSSGVGGFQGGGGYGQQMMYGPQPQQVIMQNAPAQPQVVYMQSQAQPQVQYIQQQSGMGDMPSSSSPKKSSKDDEDDIAAEVKSLIDIDAISSNVSNSTQKKINELVEKYPDETIGVIRNWLYEGK